MLRILLEIKAQDKDNGVVISDGHPTPDTIRYLKNIRGHITQLSQDSVCFFVKTNLLPFTWVSLKREGIVIVK